MTNKEEIEALIGLSKDYLRYIESNLAIVAREELIQIYDSLYEIITIL